LIEFGTDPVDKSVHWVNVIYYTRRYKDSTIFWCFPHNIPPYTRPYPGFEVLERWLDDNFTPRQCQYLRWLEDGRSLLEVRIVNKQDAFMFSLMSKHA